MSIEDRPVVSSILYGPDGEPLVQPSEGSFTGVRDAYLTTTATSTVIMRSSFWTDFGDGDQRSIKSTSSSDSSAGTGIRTVRITYYRSDGTGPFTEDVTMNGTTAVALSETDLRFVEYMEALTVGSNGASVGAIDLVENNDGTGGSLGRINVGETRGYWAQHWVAPGKTANITALFSGALSTGVLGSGVNGRVMLRKQALLTANFATVDVSFGLRVTRDEPTVVLAPEKPIRVAGPCLISLWTRPDGTASTQWFTGFSFYDS